MADTGRQRARGEVAFGTVATGLVSGPVEYSLLAPSTQPRAETPILLWLHGGGSSRRFLETCRPQFLQAWVERSLPAMVVATPSAGWSFYLDSYDGSERWETFIVGEFIEHLRSETGAVDAPVYIGGVSVGALGALRMAFKHPDRFAGVVAIEPTVEASLSWDGVLVRDQISMPVALRRRLFGDPIDHLHWRANHPTAIAVANGPAIAASGLPIYLEAGGSDRLHAHHGVDLLHRCLFDVGIPHEYRLTRGADHVGPSMGPRILEGLRFLGRGLWESFASETSIDAIVEVEQFDRQVRQLEVQAGYRQTYTVAAGSADVEVHLQGEGPTVVLLPSLGRGAGDFADLADRLAAAGYRTLSPEPRGAVGSSRHLQTLSLSDLADDVAAVIDADGGGPATLIGHDFGATVAEMLARRRPDLVASLVLLAPGGPDEARSEISTAHRRVFVPELSTEEHLEAIALAFFADGNDPVVWLDGWHRSLARAQQRARARAIKDGLVGAAGPADGSEPWPAFDTLVLRPDLDRLVPAQATRRLVDAIPSRVMMVDIPGAGHALLPEQPAAVAVAILTWLRSRS